MKQLLSKMAWLPWGMLIAILAFSINSCHNKNKENKLLYDNLSITRDSVRNIVNKNGELVNQVRVIKIESNNFRDVAVALGIDKKKLQEEIGKKSQLISYYKAQLQVTETFTVAGEDSVLTQTSDSTKVSVRYFPYHSKYLTADMFYFPISDSLRVDYRYSTGFTYKMYDKKIGWFKPRQTYVDFMLDDPHASLTQAQSVLIVPARKKVYERNWFWGGIGFIAGVLIGR